MEWEQDISMFDWFFTPNNTSSKVIAITIGTIKYCYNICETGSKLMEWNQMKFDEMKAMRRVKPLPAERTRYECLKWI